MKQALKTQGHFWMFHVVDVRLGGFCICFESLKCKTQCFKWSLWFSFATQEIGYSGAEAGRQACGKVCGQVFFGALGYVQSGTEEAGSPAERCQGTKDQGHSGESLGISWVNIIMLAEGLHQVKKGAL